MILQIIKSQNKKNLHVKEKIEKCISISLHIRRGDYVSNTSTWNM